MPAPHHWVFYRPDALLAAQPTVTKHGMLTARKAEKQNTVAHNYIGCRTDIGLQSSQMTITHKQTTEKPPGQTRLKTQILASAMSDVHRLKIWLQQFRLFSGNLAKVKRQLLLYASQQVTLACGSRPMSVKANCHCGNPMCIIIWR